MRRTFYQVKQDVIRSEVEWKRVMNFALRPPRPEDGRDRPHPDYIRFFTEEENEEIMGIAEDDPNRDEKLQRRHEKMMVELEEAKEF